MRLLIVLGNNQNYQNVALSYQLMDDGRVREYSVGFLLVVTMNLLIRRGGMNSTLYIPQSYGVSTENVIP